MATLRELNLLSQARIDIPHLRTLDSGVRGDFDTVVGRVAAGNRALVVRGFTVSNVGSVAATALELNTADGILYNLNATESGSFLWIPTDRAAEVLNPTTNGAIDGSWTSGQTNYVGLDFSRTADATTTDIVQFKDADTGLETPRSVPTAKTLDYRIVISTVPFAAQSNLVPVAKVTLNSSGVVTAMTDSRNMLNRLGRGGDSPDAEYSYPWANGRTESTALTNSMFTGGDKNIYSDKDWKDAIMTRLWEVGGGEYWYSATADRNCTQVNSGTPFSNGEYFEWDGTNLHWTGLVLLFDNSTALYNTVADQTIDSSGLTNLADGECIYVDVDRATNAAALTAQKTELDSLGAGDPSGSRWVLAWRYGTEIFIRGSNWSVGNYFAVATTTSTGIVKLSRAATTPSSPIVIADTGGTITGPASATGLIVNGGAAQLAAAFTGGGNANGITVTAGTRSSSGAGQTAATVTGGAGSGDNNDGGVGISVFGGDAGAQGALASADGGHAILAVGGVSVDNGGSAPLSGAGIKATGGAGSVPGYGVWGIGGSAADGTYGGYFEGGDASSDDAGHGIYAIGGTSGGAGAGNLPGHGAMLIGGDSNASAPGGAGAVGIGDTVYKQAGLIGLGGGLTTSSISSSSQYRGGFFVGSSGSDNASGILAIGGVGPGNVECHGIEGRIGHSSNDDSAAVYGAAGSGTNQPGLWGVASATNPGISGTSAAAGDAINAVATSTGAALNAETSGAGAAVSGTATGSGNAGYFTSNGSNTTVEIENTGTGAGLSATGAGNEPGAIFYPGGSANFAVEVDSASEYGYTAAKTSYYYPNLADATIATPANVSFDTNIAGGTAGSLAWSGASGIRVGIHVPGLATINQVQVCLENTTGVDITATAQIVRTYRDGTTVATEEYHDQTSGDTFAMTVVAGTSSWQTVDFDAAYPSGFLAPSARSNSTSNGGFLWIHIFGPSTGLELHGIEVRYTQTTHGPAV